MYEDTKGLLDSADVLAFALQLEQYLLDVPEWRVQLVRADDPHMLYKMLGAYEKQVIVEVARECYLKGEFDLDLAALQGCDWRRSLVKQYRKARGLRLITLYGTARDQSVTEEMREFMALLAKRAVACGYSLANGGSTTGAMGLAIRTWLEEIRAQGRSDVKIVTVPLGWVVEKGQREEKFELGEEGIMFPPIFTLELRGSILHFGGEPMARVFVDGGLGTIEEIASDLLGQQLGRNTYTVHSHRSGKLPPFFFVGTTWRDGTGFWEPLRDMFGRMVEREVIHAEDVQSAVFTTLENPASVVDRILGVCG